MIVRRAIFSPYPRMHAFVLAFLNRALTLQFSQVCTVLVFELSTNVGVHNTPLYER